MRIDISGDVIDNDLQRIYDWIGFDGTSPRKVKAALDAAKPGEAIDVYINSPGGSVFAGAEIYSMLREKNATVHISGLAASAASVIACAGTRTLISPAGCMMIHNVQSWTEGDYRDMLSMAETLRAVNRTIIGAYTEKTGKDARELQRLMDAETWMPAAECVEHGFCDAIEERPAKKEARAGKLAARAGLSLSDEQIERARAEIAAADAAKAERRTNGPEGDGAPEDTSRRARLRLRLTLARNNLAITAARADGNKNGGRPSKTKKGE